MLRMVPRSKKTKLLLSSNLLLTNIPKEVSGKSQFLTFPLRPHTTEASAQSAEISKTPAEARDAKL